MTESKKLTIDELLKPENYAELMRMAREEPTKLEALQKEEVDKIINRVQSPEYRMYYREIQNAYEKKDWDEYSNLMEAFQLKLKDKLGGNL